MSRKTVSKSVPAGKRRKLSPDAAKLLPYPDFPLSPHIATNRWYKVIRGTRHYFGPLDDPQAAVDAYNRKRDDLHAGRRPVDPGDGYTVRDMVNGWLNAQQAKVDNGELQQRTFDGYHRTASVIVDTCGKSRLVANVHPDDFAKLRSVLAAEHSPVTLGIVMQRVRQAFKWAYDSGHIAAPVRYGQAFSKPSRKVLRTERNAKPVKLFTPAEIHALLAAASVPMRAAILLGINCGYGNNDISELPLSAVDLSSGLANFPRPKTGIERRAVLWAESVAAIEATIAARPEPAAEHAHRLFITRFGDAWVRYHVGKEVGKGCVVDNVAREFTKLRNDLNLTTGRGFYTLRHTFETIAGETGDQACVDFIMGHAPDASNMAAVYREWSGNERERARLQRIADHVREWLFPSVSSTRPLGPSEYLPADQTTS